MHCQGLAGSDLQWGGLIGLSERLSERGRCFLDVSKGSNYYSYEVEYLSVSRLLNETVIFEHGQG